MFLKLAAQRIPVRGIVYRMEQEVRENLKDFSEEAPKLLVRTSHSQSDEQGATVKQLIVIDGLLAFAGATDLSLDGWRKAAQGDDMVEIVTDLEDVIELHNHYFSPLWAKRSGYGETVMMEREPLSLLMEEKDF